MPELAAHPAEPGKASELRASWLGYVAASLAFLDEGCCVVDPAGRLLSVNDAATRLLRQSSAELLGQPLTGLLPAATAAALATGMSRGRRLAPIPTTVADAQPVQVSLTPIADPADVPVGFVLTFRDLSEHRELKQKLLRADRLATIGLLASSVAHEVGTPLNVILGRAEMLEETLADNPGAKRQIAAISKQIQRISDVVARLLTFSRDHDTNAEPVALNEVLGEVVQFVAGRLRRNQIQLDLELAPTLPTLNGNTSHFYQVFLNLVMNAIDAMPKGGTLKLRTSVCSGLENLPQLALCCRCVQAEVIDTGEGVAPENLKRIFEPFFTTKERSRGTGLGLAIADEIVRRYAGHLHLDSTVGRGTRFTLTLPVQPTATPQ